MEKKIQLSNKKHYWYNYSSHFIVIVHRALDVGYQIPKLCKTYCTNSIGLEEGNSYMPLGAFVIHC
jgi:hypothetical protein